MKNVKVKESVAKGLGTLSNGSGGRSFIVVSTIQIRN